MSSSEYEELERDIRSKVRAFNAAKSELWRSISTLKRSEGVSGSERKKLLSDAYSPLSVKDIRPRFAMDFERFDIGVSFRTSVAHTRLWEKSLKRDGAGIASVGNLKTADQKFAARLRIPLPAILQEQETIDNINLRPNTVLKPEEGSAANGVFLLTRTWNLCRFLVATDICVLMRLFLKSKVRSLRTSLFGSWSRQSHLTKWS